jgi:hypothetical protein
VRGDKGFSEIQPCVPHRGHRNTGHRIRRFGLLTGFGSVGHGSLNPIVYEWGVILEQSGR